MQIPIVAVAICLLIFVTDAIPVTSNQRRSAAAPRGSRQSRNAHNSVSHTQVYRSPRYQAVNDNPSSSYQNGYNVDYPPNSLHNAGYRADDPYANSAQYSSMQNTFVQSIVPDLMWVSNYVLDQNTGMLLSSPVSRSSFPQIEPQNPSSSWPTILCANNIRAPFYYMVSVDGVSTVYGFPNVAGVSPVLAVYHVAPVFVPFQRYQNVPQHPSYSTHPINENDPNIYSSRQIYASEYTAQMPDTSSEFHQPTTIESEQAQNVAYDDGSGKIYEVENSVANPQSDDAVAEIDDNVGDFVESDHISLDSLTLNDEVENIDKEVYKDSAFITSVRQDYQFDEPVQIDKESLKESTEDYATNGQVDPFKNEVDEVLKDNFADGEVSPQQDSAVLKEQDTEVPVPASKSKSKSHQRRKVKKKSKKMPTVSAVSTSDDDDFFAAAIEKANIERAVLEVEEALRASQRKIITAEDTSNLVDRYFAAYSVDSLAPSRRDLMDRTLDAFPKLSLVVEQFLKLDVTSKIFNDLYTAMDMNIPSVISDGSFLSDASVFEGFENFSPEVRTPILSTMHVYSLFSRESMITADVFKDLADTTKKFHDQFVQLVRLKDPSVEEEKKYFKAMEATWNYMVTLIHKVKVYVPMRPFLLWVCIERLKKLGALEASHENAHANRESVNTVIMLFTPFMTEELKAESLLIRHFQSLSHCKDLLNQMVQRIRVPSLPIFVNFADLDPEHEDPDN